MVYVLACPADTGPFGLQPIAQIARRKGVPVFVDAAAENLTPEIHLSRGADLVAYSGGKAIRGPQCAGLLLGRKDLCQAAWLNSAPHHAFGRSLKVGKEEIMGMLAGVEMWYQRDHAAEWKEWEGWLATIADKAGKIQGVTTEVKKPSGLSNNTPQLRICWDGARMGISGEEVFNLLLNQNPRINLALFTGTRREDLEKSSVSVLPWMMQSGEDKIVAARLYEVLSNPPKRDVTQKNDAPAVQIRGRWNARLQFSLGSDSHSFVFEQQGDALAGTHQGELVTGSLRGRVEGNQIEFHSSQAYEGTRLQYSFRGQVDGDSMRGNVDMGEYGETQWEAHRQT
jgi:L-seryl-tRNA(Ser) seleniumtransferase